MLYSVPLISTFFSSIVQHFHLTPDIHSSLEPINQPRCMAINGHNLGHREVPLDLREVPLGLREVSLGLREVPLHMHDYGSCIVHFPRLQVHRIFCLAQGQIRPCTLFWQG